MGAIGCFDHEKASSRRGSRARAACTSRTSSVRPGAPEGEGYLLALVNRLAENRSDLVILDAQRRRRMARSP